MSQTAQACLFSAKQPLVQGLWKLPSGWEWVSLEEAFSIRSGTLEPSRVPEEMFCLYSMPAYDAGGNPELGKGREIGSAKILVEPGDILLSKLNPRIPRVWRVTDDKNLASSLLLIFFRLSANQPQTEDRFSTLFLLCFSFFLKGFACKWNVTFEARLAVVRG
jgi:type I restriction enzyme S subunit